MLRLSDLKLSSVRVEMPMGVVFNCRPRSTGLSLAIDARARKALAPRVEIEDMDDATYGEEFEAERLIQMGIALIESWEGVAEELNPDNIRALLSTDPFGLGFINRYEVAHYGNLLAAAKNEYTPSSSGIMEEGQNTADIAV